MLEDKILVRVIEMNQAEGLNLDHESLPEVGPLILRIDGRVGPSVDHEQHLTRITGVGDEITDPNFISAEVDWHKKPYLI